VPEVPSAVTPLLLAIYPYTCGGVQFPESKTKHSSESWRTSPIE